MVPLPLQGQGRFTFGAVEFIGGNAGRDRVALYLYIERRQLFALLAQHGPFIHPLHGDEVRDAADGGAVAKKERIPFALGRIDESALSDAFASESDPPFIGAQEVIGAENGLGPHITRGPGDVEKVILTVDFTEVRALRRQPRPFAGDVRDVGDQNLVDAPLLDSGEVGFQLSDADIVAAVNHEGAPILFKVERVVMEHRAKGNLFPRFVFYVFGFEDVGFAGGLGKGADVVGAVVEAEAAGPGAVAVSAFSVAQPEGVLLPQHVMGIGDHLPVNQVPGLHDREPRAEVHGGAAHVVGVSGPDHCHIGDVGPDNGVIV